MFIDFILGDLGLRACSSGYSLITTTGGCSLAAKALGYYYDAGFSIFGTTSVCKLLPELWPHGPGADSGLRTPYSVALHPKIGPQHRCVCGEFNAIGTLQYYIFSLSLSLSLCPSPFFSLEPFCLAVLDLKHGAPHNIKEYIPSDNV
jgi:hypothetical protein